MTHNFKDALDSFEKSITDSDIVTNFIWMRTHEDTIRLSLKLADRLIGNASVDMVQAGINSYNQNGQFAVLSHYKAMRDQLLKECGE